MSIHHDEIDYQRLKEDAEFTVEIANRRIDELVAALRLALPWVSPPLDDHDMSASGVAHRAVVAALAKASEARLVGRAE